VSSTLELSTAVTSDSLRGLLPATVTPFADDLSLDEAALARHLKAVAEADGVAGLVVNGHIGEICALTPEEQAQCVRIAREVALPGQFVISGVESRTARGLVSAGEAARDAGADGLLVLPPLDMRAYRRLCAHPPALLHYISALESDVGLPMILHQYPKFTGAAYSFGVLDAVVDIPLVVGLKAAAFTVTHYAEIWDAFHSRVAVLASTDAPSLLGMMLHGTHGSLIGIGVIAPEVWAGVLRAAQEGRGEEARQIFNTQCLPLLAAVFQNQEPTTLVSEASATKEALAQLGQLTNSLVRPPSVGVDGPASAAIRDALMRARLL